MTNRSRSLNKRIGALFQRPVVYTVRCEVCAYFTDAPRRRPLAWILDLLDTGCPECGSALTVNDFQTGEIRDACRVCGEPVTGRRRAYCSGRCSDIANAVQRMFTWSAVRERVLDRDGYACQACGVDVSEDADADAEVDHITPLADGGAPLDERNLITLCGDCHAEKTHGDAADDIGVGADGRPERLAPHAYVGGSSG